MAMIRFCKNNASVSRATEQVFTRERWKQKSLDKDDDGKDDDDDNDDSNDDIDSEQWWWFQDDDNVFTADKYQENIDGINFNIMSL